MASARAPLRVAILGCGAVGRALALAILARGGSMRLRVWSRDPRSVARLRHLAGGRSPRIRRLDRPEQAFACADVVYLAVADAALEACVSRLAGDAARGAGRIVLVASGAFPLAKLSPLVPRGVVVGRLHPLAAVPVGREAEALAETAFALEGPARARRTAREIARRLGNPVLELQGHPEGVQAYHAAASLVGGGLVALLELGAQVMQPAVRRGKDVAPALDLFARGVLENVRALGAPRALTGALARGDEALVRRHLTALAGSRDAERAYRALGGALVELSRARGSLDRRQAARLHRLLAASAPRRTRQ